MNVDLPGHPVTGWGGHAGVFGRSHRSEIVEDLHGRAAASRMQAKEFSLIRCFLTPSIPLRRGGTLAGQSSNPKFL